MHPACLATDELVRQCRIRRQRRSGPGGQHRNKVETAIVIRHEPSGIEATATERRSQAANRRTAIHRLRMRLALRLRGKTDAELFLRRWQDRIVGQRLCVAASHEDFPAVLAGLLDLVFSRRADVRRVALELNINSSQLVRFLKLDPDALELVNVWRKDAGRSRLL